MVSKLFKKHKRIFVLILMILALMVNIGVVFKSPKISDAKVKELKNGVIEAQQNGAFYSIP